MLTGGAGYIGSHTALVLAAAGHHVIVFDNLSNSDRSVIDRLRQIAAGSITFEFGDVRDQPGLVAAMRRNEVEAVIHFAAKKSVPESFGNPLDYYDNNIAGSITLLQSMDSLGIRTIVFSSSANVYGKPLFLPIDELHPRSPTSPYGCSKIVVEDLLSSLFSSDDRWNIGILRYFNPAGSHPSHMIGEDINCQSGNLMTVIVRAALGLTDAVSIYGDDYDTHDGSGVRDYIHVVDLAEGHLAAMQFIVSGKRPPSTWNLGTGRGTSVLDLVNAFERVNGVSLVRDFRNRRVGDVPSCYADASKANLELEWTCTRSIDDMCSSSWAFAMRGRI